MEPKHGRIEKRRGVHRDAPDGTEVTVLIGTPEAVTVSDEELEAIDAGLREAEASARIDARAFLCELRANR